VFLEGKEIFPVLSVVISDVSDVSDVSDMEDSVFSVLDQVGQNFELLLVTNRFYNNQLVKENDKIIILPNNTSDFYETLNNASLYAKGHFITFLRVGDLLSSQCVKILSMICFENKSAQLIVTDEGYLKYSCYLNSIFFKPDWNPDYLLSYNYFSLGVIFNRELFINIKGFNSSAIDPYHDLSLRLTSILLAKEIVHIDEILFYFKRRISNKVYDNRYKLPFHSPLVSIIIPTKDQSKLLRKCIDDLIHKTDYKNIEIIIIDNKSKEVETLSFFNKIANRSDISIIQYNKKFNYSEMNNIAVSQAKGKFIVLLNNDISVINKDWLTEMVSQANRPEIGCVGAKLFYPDGTIQHAGVILGLKGYASHAHKGFPGDSTGYFNRLVVTHNVSAVTAACLVMRKEIFEEVGGFDAVNLKVAYNDVDLCLKVRDAGYRNLFTPHAQLVHHESKSRGKKRSFWQRRQLRAESRFLRKKWGNVLFSDPAYNKNLTLLREDFSPKDDDEKI
jgi:GT2 family glycosyltransferase